MNVRELTEAYLRGEATADQVIDAVQPYRTPEVSVEESIRQFNEDYAQPPPPNTWKDVTRYWSLMSPEQKRELQEAKHRAAKSRRRSA